MFSQNSKEFRYFSNDSTAIKGNKDFDDIIKSQISEGGLDHGKAKDIQLYAGSIPANSLTTETILPTSGSKAEG